MNVSSNTGIQIKCHAKINLSLDVTGMIQHQNRNYHTLDSIFQLVSVYDILSLSVVDLETEIEEDSRKLLEEFWGDHKIFLFCDTPGIPCDERNLAYKAAALFLQHSGKKAWVKIRLEKHIPSGAGMGGGSADAAGVLYGLNQLLHTGYTNQELRELGVQLGADVPFFLLGGTAFAQGIGEKLIGLKPWNGLPLVILKGKQSISTPEAYRAIDALVNPVHPDTENMLKAIAVQDQGLLCRSCGNLFESAISCEDVNRAKRELLSHGAECAIMTGSGSAVFGIFKNQKLANTCAELLKSESGFEFVQACQTQELNFEKLKQPGGV
ncbi:MAG: 4-(cytidine 5'-diphospho)-2-C-methyl-D-erythritol kinase [Oscillospiraceae bacterium]|nr:4-(cytidine 5'-diphospho)-2-C-methyl-D-erythritol kinase [Oscillospiraceae bacterium]